LTHPNGSGDIRFTHAGKINGSGITTNEVLMIHRALIFCRNLAGHRQIYCYSLAMYCVGCGYEVVIVTQAEEKLNPLPQQTYQLLYSLHAKPGIIVKALPNSMKTDIELLNESVDKYTPDIIFLPDGDTSLKSIPKDYFTPIRIIAIFLRYASMTPWLDRLNTKGLLHGTVSKLSGYLRDYSFFKYQLSKHLPNARILLLDPRPVQRLHQPNVYWLPDIYQPIDKPENGFMHQDSELERVKTFLLRTKPRRVILYFGTNQLRRGYEWLLRLVQENNNLVFLHCGRLDEVTEITSLTRSIRSALGSEGRIMELGKFVTDERLIDLAYSASDCVLLPYQSHYGSSGVMLQAVSYDKQVLVPQNGLMAYWCNRYELGRVFKAGSYTEFVSQYYAICHLPGYSSGKGRDFINLFSKDSIYKILDLAVNS
jgi:glycosyltransferase involved in cell wall biosynthesis